VLPIDASHALSSVLSDLLAVTLNDNVREAADWASNTVRPRACALVDHAGSEEQVDELVRAILRLKQRANLATSVKDARSRQQAAAHTQQETRPLLVQALHDETDDMGGLDSSTTSSAAAAGRVDTSVASTTSNVGNEVTVQLSREDSRDRYSHRAGPSDTADHGPRSFNNTASSIGSDF
jgi:hypothetical protein